MHTFVQLFTNASYLLLSLGYIGLFACVFAESGLFFGFFLPGDTLLFAAGLLAAQHTLSLGPVLILIMLGAILGDTVGYWFGAWAGSSLFTRKDSRFFHHSHVIRAQHFYERYGTYAILLARFIPIVRTFAPIVAGIGKMPYRIFLPYNVAGGMLWGVGITLIGYFLGVSFPIIVHYLTAISLGIAALSLLPIVVLQRKR